MVKGLVMGIVVACAVLACAGSASAQEGLVNAGIGVKGGVVFPQFSADVDNRPGWQAGISIGGNRGGILGVQGELNLVHKRIADRLDPDIAVAVDYLQIPVLLRLHTRSRSASGVQVYGLVGPSVDVKLQESFKGVRISGPEGFKTLDLSGVIGAGIELGMFSVEGRYSRGFRQINRNGPDSTFKAHSFAVLLGLRLS